MKNVIILGLVALMATPAMASKARMTALSNSRQIVDFQTAFDRPYQFMALSTAATFEWGTNGDAAARHAEGGFIHNSGDQAYGVYFGRRSDDFSTAVTNVRSNATAPAGALANLTYEQNPMNLYYASKMGEWTWGATVKYSNGKAEGTQETKATSAGLSLGVTNGTWEVEVVQGLSGKTEMKNVVASSDFTLESKGLTKVNVGYNMNEHMQVYGKFSTSKIEGKGTGALAASTTLNATVETTKYNVGMINTLNKNEDVNFFYGVEYSSDKVKDGTETTTLPVWLGIEANATSWMVMRASVKQNVLINETKTAAGVKSDLDSVVFAAGAGLKLGKGMLDATFATASNGHLSFGDGSTAANQFFSNVGYTYNF